MVSFGANYPTLVKEILPSEEMLLHGLIPDVAGTFFAGKADSLKPLQKHSPFLLFISGMPASALWAVYLMSGSLSVVTAITFILFISYTLFYSVH